MSDFIVHKPTLFHPDRTVDVQDMAHRAIEVAERRYDPVAIIGMFSGGRDSLVACHIASQHPAYTATVHLNTGIGVAETREYVWNTSDVFDAPFAEYAAEDQGQYYDEMVLAHGFPGPYAHRFMYIRLKERPLAAMMRDHSGGNILLVNGARRQESVRRTGNVKRIIQKDGRRVWVAPLAEWSALQRNQYIKQHGLPTNDVSDLMHMSGECLCGAFAHPGELEEWETFGGHLPGVRKVVKRIRGLERECEKRNVHCSWNDPPQRGAASNPDQIEAAPLCSSCEWRHKEDT